MSDSEPGDVVAEKSEDDEHQRKFICPACDFISEKSDSLKDHLITEHKWSELKLTELECCVCKIIIPIKKDRLIHEATAHKATVSRDPEQPTTSRTEESELEESEAELEELPITGIFHCDKCNRRFISQDHLNIHVTASHPARTIFECPDSLCFVRYSNEKKLRIHLLDCHSGRDKPFVCDLCDMRFLEKGFFESHRLLHGFQCPYVDCKVFCTEESDLYCHILLDHKFKSFSQCPFCLVDKIIQSPEQFTEHCKKSHPYTYPYQCTECGKSLKGKVDLFNHIADSHSSSKRRKSSEVESSEVETSEVETSEVESSEVEDLEGAVGGSPFKTSQEESGEVLTPESSSTPKKIFFKICKTCHGRFIGHEKWHVCSHVERISTCVLCSSQFTSYKNLYLHSISKHLFCINCSRTFADKNLAKDHISKIHREFALKRAK